MKIHRLVTLIVMVLLGLFALGIGIVAIPSNPSGPSLLALLIVVAGAAIAGVAMSWKRYRVRPDGHRPAAEPRPAGSNTSQSESAASSDAKR